MIEIRHLGPRDVDSLIDCVIACYGESYTEPRFYDAAVLRDEIGASRLLSVGAVDDGRVVGHLGTWRASDTDVVVDTIAGIVHPDYRGRGLTAAMGSHMVASYAGLGIVGARHLATAAHDRTQRLLVASGAVVTGVLLAHLPPSTDYRGISHSFGRARIAVVVYYQSYGRLPPLDVYVPDRYPFLAELYRQLDLDRRPQPGAHVVGLDGWPSATGHDPGLGITTLRFGILADPTHPQPAQDISVTVRGDDWQPVVYADLPLTDPRTPTAVDLLGNQGFHFAALLPGTLATETLRLQRHEPGVAAPHAAVIASPAGQTLLTHITTEHRATTDGEPRPAEPAR